MSQSNKAGLKGSSVEYRVNSEAKRYTMRDNAFTETKNGNFQYERKLTAQGTATNVPILKITIGKDFKRLRILSLAPNGIREINLYENDEMKEARELAEFYLEDFVNEKVLEHAE